MFSLFDKAKSLKDINDTVVRNEAVNELLAQINDYEQERGRLLDRIRELEQRIEAHDKWEAITAFYELVKLDPGGFAYALKAGADTSEPPHHICPNCYNDRTRSILQSHGRNRGVEDFRCPRCQFNTRAGHPEPVRVRGRGVISPGIDQHSWMSS